MKIAVLIKQVPGSESALPINDSQNWIDESSVTFVMNPPDNYALEEALILKEKIGEGEVVIVSMGPNRVQKVIREGLAKGADRGIHLLQEGKIENDPLTVSKKISTALKEENFDLILSGLQSDDTGMSQTGVLIGEFLGMSTATLVVETKIENDRIRLKKELESGWYQWVVLPIPASISIQSGINTPRYPSLKGIMGSKKKEIKCISSDLKSDQSQTIENISLPLKSKQTEIIELDVDGAVSRIMEILKSDVKVF
ncbi:MAG: electron transfer flavoprotein subunit beta/FixA family protein [Candidatus Neomarinimicrobiota bacterium]|nr:electron transfer flavoprotein subunit beta/FixA family protein [Candidatus Neomarinimicrobiota bacterium]